LIRSSKWARRIFALQILVAVPVVLVGITGESVGGSDPWLETLPTHAEAHYGTWRKAGRDWAHPAWHSFWLDRNPPNVHGPVIVDRRHTRKQPLDMGIGPNEYRYNQMHGLGSLGRELQRNGVAFKNVTTPLTGRTLGGASMVFINLPSGDGPGFSHAEVISLGAFVRAGGGLVLLTDHTNAYFHGEMLTPLARDLGFEIPPVTACDKSPGHTMSPKTTTWIVPRTQGEHPILKGVDRLGLMTAGGLVPLPESDFQVLAQTSSAGWQDHWSPFKKPKSAGMTGNMAQDVDEPDEAVPVLIAGNVGQGRVVVLSDQNAMGAVFVGMEDNLQFGLNAFAWARGAGESWLAPSPEVEVVAGEAYACGTVSGGGFHTFFVSTARHASAHNTPARGSRHSCRATPGLRAQTRIWLPGTKPRPEDLKTSLRTILLESPDAGLLPLLGKEKAFKETSLGRLWHLEGGQRVLLSKNPEWLNNRFLGKERSDPAKGDSRTQQAHEWANALLDWAYGEP
jgi:hypothetical protein